MKTIYLTVFLTIAGTVYMMQRINVPLPVLINNHLNDFLCMPVVLKLCLHAAQYIKSDQHMQLPILLSVALTLLFILFFEFLLPKTNLRYTGDFLDSIAYTAGLVFFIAVERPEKLF